MANSDVIERKATAVAAEKDLPLPFNLESGLGGVDATGAVFSRSSLRPGLFDFEAGGAVTRSVNWPSAPGVADQFAHADFRVPSALEFSWTSENVSSTVSGETKASFQRNLSNEVHAGISIGGFGAEFSSTFEEEHLQETYQKYVARYQRQQVYSVRFLGDPASMLSAKAKADFAALGAKAIVDKYGTHYMTSAIFGGVEVYSSRLDIRDEVSSTKLTEAMDVKFAGSKGSANAGTKSSDATVRKLHDQMSLRKSRTIGGSVGAGDQAWIQSLYTNPSVIAYELAFLSDLVPEAKRADVKAEIDRRITATAVTCNKMLLGMMVDLDYYDNDRGSGSSSNLSVARPRNLPGWYYIGQWGIAKAGDAFGSGYKAMVFRPVPGATGLPAIRSAQGFSRRWGKSSSWGLFTAAAMAGYTGIGDIYESTDSAASITCVDFYGMVRDDLLIDSYWGAQIWNDHGSKARDDGSAYKFYHYETRDTPDDQRMLIVPGGKPEASLFKVFSGYDTQGTLPKRLDWAKIKLLTNSWLE